MKGAHHKTLVNQLEGTMGQRNTPQLRLVTSEAVSNSTAQRRSVDGSAVVIEVERGKLRSNVVQALSHEDAAALLSGLAMAIVQVIRAQQTF